MNHSRRSDPRRAGLRVVSPIATLALVLLLNQCKSSSSGGGDPPETPPNTLVPQGAVTVTEGQPKAAILVSRSNPAGGDMAVDFETVGGSAESGVDFTAASGTLRWSASDVTDKIIEIDIADDQEFEGIEQFSIRFTNVVGGGLSPSIATVLILDDEETPAPTDPTQFVADRFGFATSMAGVGDVNGDQMDDYVLGNGNADQGKGQVFLRSGLTGRALYTITGGAGEGLGATVSGAGDLDKDGTPDFAAAAPNGASWVVRAYSGKTGNQLYEWKGTAPGPWTGLTVAAAGDFNQDTYADLAIGLPNTTAGSVEIYSGRDGALLATLKSGQSLPSFGRAVAGIGDVDLDGFSDVAIGAPGENTGAGNEGAVYVFSGRSGTELRRIAGEIPDGRLGTSVAAAMDVDGNGTPDFVVGVPGVVADTGEARVYSGSSFAVLFTFRGDPGSHAGHSVAGVGDVNNDGSPDIAVGEPGDVVAGVNLGGLKVYSGKNGAPLQRYSGMASGKNFGWVVAAAGDPNNDGTPDLLVGSTDTAYLLSGRSLRLTASANELSLRQGGDITFNLEETNIGPQRDYVIAGSLGTSPGSVLGGIRVPLNADAWFRTSLTLFQIRGFQQMRGRFDANGRRQATVSFPRTTSTAGVGLTLFHAFVILDERARFVGASNAVPLRLAQ